MNPSRQSSMSVSNRIVEKLVERARPAIVQAVQQSYDEAARDIEGLNKVLALLELPAAGPAASAHPQDAPGRKVLEKLTEPVLLDIAVNFLRAIVADASEGRWEATSAAAKDVSAGLLATDLPLRVGLDPPALRLALAAMEKELLDLVKAGPIELTLGGRTTELRRGRTTGPMRAVKDTGPRSALKREG